MNNNLDFELIRFAAKNCLNELNIKSTIDGRIGRLKYLFDGQAQRKNPAYCTPNTMIYTRHGHIPHVTRDLFDHNVRNEFHQNFLFQVSLPSIFTSINIINSSGGLRNFYKMPVNSNLHFTLLDPLELRDIVVNNYIYIWSRRNRRKVDMNFFKNVLEALKIDSFSTPFDFDTKNDCGEKKLQKNLKRTENFLHQLYCHEDVRLMGNEILSIGGGTSVQHRIHFARELYKQYRDVKAFNVDLFPWSELGNENFDQNSVADLIRKTLSVLPDNKLRIGEGPFNPDKVIFLIAEGIDMFDSSYAVYLAEKGMAFQLANGFPLEKGNSQYHLIDLNNSSGDYIDEHSCLFPQCACYTCQSGKGHTRAYISHLLQCKEMLAFTLLTMHNLYEWFRMFELIRSHLTEGKT